MRFPKKFSHYIVEEVINSGDEEKCVWRGRDTMRQRQVVFKFFNRQSSDFFFIEQELRVSKALNHPNIASIIDIQYLQDCIVSIQDYYENGDLLDAIVGMKLTDDEKYVVFSGILDGVIYLHNHNIAHLDLKPENILLDNKNCPKITDFGCCETSDWSSQRYFNRRGTLAYIAPEILKENECDHREADIWSMGIILNVLITKYFPWNFETIDELTEKVINAELLILNTVPSHIKEIIQKCCQLDPLTRPTASELKLMMFDKKSDHYSIVQCITNGMATNRCSSYNQKAPSLHNNQGTRRTLYKRKLIKNSFKNLSGNSTGQI